MNNVKQPINQHSTLIPTAIGFVCVAIIIWFWAQRDEYWLHAEEGIGYALGIVGAVLMVALLLYPLSKNNRLMRRFIPIRFWFKGHMFLGIAGPLMILLHCNFSLGSTNSNIALASMLLVVLSGLIGRYLYRQLHNGLYGKKHDYNELQQQYSQHKQALINSLLVDRTLLDLFSRLESLNTNANHSLYSQWQCLRQAKKIDRQLQRHLSSQVFRQQTTAIKELKQTLNQQLTVMSSMMGLAFYSKLFSLWHIVHLPFFYLLIITAIVHIVTVTMY